MTGTPSATASPARVWELVNGFVAYHAVRAASELGVFEQLATGPCAVDELAARCGAEPARLLALLTANLAAGTLELEGDRFELSAFSAAHLLPGEAGYLGSLLRHSPGPLENWSALAATVRGQAPPRDVGGEGGAFLAELVEGTFPAQLAAARAALAGPLAGMLPPGCRVVDVGAGGAPWSLAVLEQDPQARAVVNDLPTVLEVARRTLGAAGVLGRAELLAGDYWSVEPSGPADLVALGHVCRAEGDAGAGRLVRRAGGWLRPGGMLVVTEYLLDDDRRGPQQAQLLGLTMTASTARGATFTRSQALRWLSSAGLDLVALEWPLPPTAVLLARRPAR